MVQYIVKTQDRVLSAVDCGYPLLTHSSGLTVTRSFAGWKIHPILLASPASTTCSATETPWNIVVVKPFGTAHLQLLKTDNVDVLFSLI